MRNGLNKPKPPALYYHRPRGIRVQRHATLLIVIALLPFQAALAADAPDALPAVPAEVEPCLSCHAYQPDSEPMEGPSLWGVVGRRIASVEGYDYSPALKGVDGTWDRATLDRFLSNTKAFAPGLRMTLGGVRDPADRAVVLDFLERLGPGTL
jgi:cytochrome c